MSFKIEKETYLNILEEEVEKLFNI